MAKSFQEEIRDFYVDLPDRQERFKNNTELLHACLGLSGETGEVIDIIKKHLAYGKTLDMDKLEEELGDVIHYLSRVADLTGLTLQDMMDNNLKKLKKRYPSGYTNQDAINQTERT
jgi:NTP pyrophosphatase (non-canonical NTP hydrolase)